jgi:NAD(P)-dependent dehydrogenase (short-subunit alcohol dehydrogenase family)
MFNSDFLGYTIRVPDQLKTAIVFGGHSPIAIAISKTLNSSHKVFHVSRNVDKSLTELFESFKNVSFLQFDIAADNQIIKSFNDSLHDGIDLLIFAHRFRGNMDAMDQEFDIQVRFPALLIEELQNKNKLKIDSLIVFFSSPAASYIVDDQTVSYHVCKAAVNQLVRYFANQLAPRTRVVGISPGGFVLKKRNENYFKKNRRKTKVIRDFLPLGTLLTTETIANFVKLISLPQAEALNGQIISLDGGYLNIEPSQLINRLIIDELS